MWFALLIAAITLVIAESLPATRRLAEMLAGWAARHQYATDQERACRRDEEWRAMLRDRFALSGLATVLILALSYLASSTARRSKSVLRRRQEESQEQLRAPREARVIPTFLDLAARTRLSFGMDRYAEVRQTGWQLLGQSPSFRRYFSAAIVADAGIAAQQALLILFAFRLTHSYLIVGLIAFAQFSGHLNLGPWASVMVARIGAKRTLMAAHLAAALTSAFLAARFYFGTLSALIIIYAGVCLAISSAFALPARHALVIGLVPRTAVRSAVQLDTAASNFGRVTVVPVGILLASVGFGWGFAFAAICCSVFVFALYMMEKHQMQPEPARRLRLKDGLKIAGHDYRVAVLLLMSAACAITADSVVILGFGVAQHLGLSSAWWLYLLGAAGAGGILASFRRTRRSPSIRKTALYLYCLGGNVIAFAGTPYPLIAFVGAMAIGIMAFHAGSDLRLLLVQRAGPEQTAAVMAYWAVASGVGTAFAGLITALLVTSLGVEWTGIVISAPAIVPAALVIFYPRLLGLLGNDRRRNTMAHN